jgi:hypothetical protein
MFLGFDTLGNTPELKCYNGISMCLWILSYPSVYPGGSYAHARCTTSGEVKKYQEAFLALLLRNGCRIYLRT